MMDVPPGADVGELGGDAVYGNATIASRDDRLISTEKVYFPVTMRERPTVTVYAEDGEEGKLLNRTTDNNIDAEVYLAGDTGCTVRPANSGDVSEDDRLTFSYTADAEL